MPSADTMVGNTSDALHRIRTAWLNLATRLAEQRQRPHRQPISPTPAGPSWY